MSTNIVLCTGLAILAATLQLAVSCDGMPIDKSSADGVESKQLQLTKQQQAAIKRQQLFNQNMGQMLENYLLFGTRYPEFTTMDRNEKFLERAPANAILLNQAAGVYNQGYADYQSDTPSESRSSDAVLIMQPERVEQQSPRNFVARPPQSELVMQSLTNTKRNKVWRPCSVNAISCFG